MYKELSEWFAGGRRFHLGCLGYKMIDTDMRRVAPCNAEEAC